MAVGVLTSKNIALPGWGDGGVQQEYGCEEFEMWVNSCDDGCVGVGLEVSNGNMLMFAIIYYMVGLEVVTKILHYRLD